MYDPNDPDTKAAIKAAVVAALAEQADEHEADIEGLKVKNKDLIAKLKAAKAGGDGGSDDSAEVARLEGELRTATKELRAATKARDEAVDERDAASARADNEAGISKGLLTENGLTAALTKANVKPGLLSGVTALLSGKVEIKEVGGKREAQVDGKPLGEFVAEWAKSDEGKNYVAAPLNGGGGASHKLPTNPQGGEKKLSEMSLEERTAFQKDDPQKFNQLVEAERVANRQNRRKPGGF